MTRQSRNLSQIDRRDDGAEEASALTPPRRQMDDIDWAAWRPEQRATLLFVRRDGRLLLIRKKRGLGAGKINGPGGRIEPGETADRAAVREVQEELCVTPTGVRERGILRFQFADGFSIEAVVFDASGCDGEPRETDEAIPLWVSADAIPYGEMWADDAIWLPPMLAGKRFSGRFLFDGDVMLGHDVTVSSNGQETLALRLEAR